MAEIAPIKLEISNHQFLGDVICETPIPRDMAAVRRCTKCQTGVIMPKQREKGVLPCPNCGQKALEKKWRVRVDTRFPGVWTGNPYIEDYEGDADIAMKIGTGIGCTSSNHSGEHITQAFRKIILLKTGWTFPQGELSPDLHLTEHEKAMPPMVKGRYWVICIGKREPFTSKFWPPERWQKVIDSLPDITFVQIGHSNDKHPVLKGDNMINLIGKTDDERTGIRDLFRLVYHSDGCCSQVSSLMHIAAGFHKPCVVIGGAREPVRFEQYPFHRYLCNQGTMDCEGPTQGGTVIFEDQSKDIEGAFKRHGAELSGEAEIEEVEGVPGDYLVTDGDKEFYAVVDDKLTVYDVKRRHHSGVTSCWKASADACQNREQGYPKCLMMINVTEVRRAIKSFYTGGMLKPITERATVDVQDRPVAQMICNAHSWGGGERSAAWIANRLLVEEYDVHLTPTGGVNGSFKEALSPYVQINEECRLEQKPCDLFLCYTNDMVYGFQDKYALLAEVQAKRKVMVLNYRMGGAGKIDWTRTWDQYIFLCSDMEQSFKKYVPDASTVLLPPPVDLEPFLKSDFGSINRTLHIVRIGSQTSQKMPDNIREIVEQIKAAHPAASFTFMSGHETLKGLDKVECFDEFSQPVLDILRKGTVFWYPLKEKYLDNGPRVIMEAMAAGLPVVADRRGGAMDRVTDETGWLCDDVGDHVKVFSEINGLALAKKGAAARERARTEFDPERWVKAILGE